MKDNQPLKPLNPDRSYLRKFLDKFKASKKNGKSELPFIERQALYLVIALSLLITLFIHDYESSIYSYFGKSILTFILLVFFYRDLRRYKPAYLKKRKMLYLLASLILLNLVIAVFFKHLYFIFSKGLGIESSLIYNFGIPLAIGAVIVVMIFDFHTAITFSLVLSLLSGLWIKDSLFTIFVFITCLIAAFSLIRVKKEAT